MTRPDPARPDIHARITRQIITQLEAGVRPWTQPWRSNAPVSRPLRHDGTPYSGVNILLLWAEAAERGYTRSTWMTFRQALALGAHVRKGSAAPPSSTPVRPSAPKPKRRARTADAVCRS